jgi:hypothetical protein
MGIFAIEIFLRDFLFKGRKRTCKVCLRFQRCQINFGGVIDTVEIVSAVTATHKKDFALGIREFDKKKKKAWLK